MLLPEALDKTETITVIRLSARREDYGPFDDRLVGDEVGTWDGDQASQALSLIAAIPDGSPARCFIPYWAIRVSRAKDVLFEMSFCYKCSNARMWGPEIPAGDPMKFQGFAADSPAAQDLLERFRACVREQGSLR
ncbi:MAG TPA: hypothetical protein VGX23_11410 [Actinocrinis sp.]|nr:hypothetical protein [Actinocrinis sp.]